MFIIGFIVHSMELHMLFCPATAVSTHAGSCVGCVDMSQNTVRMTFFEVLKDALTGALIETSSVSPQLGNKSIVETPYNAASREGGSDWPRYGYTMTGKKRLNELQDALIKVVNLGIEGDFIECGVWRGGTSIFARLVWNAYDQNARTVFVADSFSGLPPSTSSYDNRHWDNTPYLEVDLETVKRHFMHFGAAALENTVFIKGFFNNTLPEWRNRIKKLAVLRLDGDMYESCADILANLYEKVSVNGYVIIDDWFGFECKNAVESFLAHHKIVVTVIPIDSISAYFTKPSAVTIDDEWYKAFLRTKIH